MKLGVFAVLFGDKSLEEALDKAKNAGLDAVEIGTGGYPGNSHCNPSELLQDEEKLKAFQQAFKERNLTISALSCHGNPLHPNKEIADQHHEEFEKTVLLAEKIGVDTVITFSGCPGESEHSKYPVWVTNSLLAFLISIESKCLLTSLTLSGSPTVKMVSPISSGKRFKWYTLPSGFNIRSVSDILLIF